jgi:putative ATPase
MKAEGYAAGYVYDHDAEDGFSGQDCFPPGLPRTRFYAPSDRGAERVLQKRALYLENARARLNRSESE